MEARSHSIYWLIAVSVLIFILDYSGLLFFVKVPADIVILPVKRGVYGSSVKLKNLLNVFASYPRYHSLVDDVSRLKRENEELSYRIKSLTDENISMRRQLDASLPASYTYITAPVIALSRFMELGVGETDGVKAGMPVVIGNVLLGKINAVWARRSSAILLTDTEITIPIKTDRGAKGALHGQVSDTMFFEKVLQKDPLFLNDTVVTTGEDGLPPNLVIGKVSYIQSDDASVYKQAKIDPVIDRTKERTVFVISSLH